MGGSYFVYILASRRNGTLYIGVTNDLVRRMSEHKGKFVPGFLTTRVAPSFLGASARAGPKNHRSALAIERESHRALSTARRRRVRNRLRRAPGTRDQAADAEATNAEFVLRACYPWVPGLVALAQERSLHSPGTPSTC